MRHLHTHLKRPNRGLLLSALLLCLWLIPGTSFGQTGGALSFDGVDDYIEVPNSASLNISSAITVEMWIKTTSTSNAVLIEKSNNNTNYGLQLLSSPNAGKVRFFISPDATTGQLTSNGTVNDGAWHHIAATFNDATNTMALYIDGILDNSSSTKTASIALNTQSLMIGARSGTLAFAGQIDEIRIWNRDLCANEVLNNKSCQLAAGQNGLVAIYNMNQGIANGDNRGQTAPGAPGITSLTAGSGNVSVAFTSPVSDGGSPITSYTITSSPGGITATGATSPINITGLTNGTSYTITVTATNAIGTSVASAPSVAIPTGAPTPPAITTVTAGSAQATVSFTPPTSDGGLPITSYTITSVPGGFTATGAASPLTVAGLTNGQAYTFTATATNAAGTSPASTASATATPTGVPTAPSITTVTPADAHATISFTAPTSDGGLPITNYTVTSSPGGLNATGASSPITIAGLTNGTAYTFTVTASNANGNSQNSSASSSVTPTGLPSAPLNAVATAGNAQATVSFDAPADNGGLTITNYTVTSNPGGLSATGASSPITIAGLSNGTAYTFTVTASNANGTSQNSTASSSVTPTGLPSAPLNTVATAGDAQATVSFDAPADNGGLAITNYIVTSSPGGLSATGASSPITIAGLTNGTAYTFTVTASNANGTSQNSTASAPVTPTGLPSAPLNTVATAGSAQATVSFDAPADNGGLAITNYTVTSSPGGFSATGASSPITIAGLTNGTAYTFTLTASNANGTSQNSTASAPVTPTGLPSAPLNAVATAGDAHATVSFDAPADNGGLAITNYTVTSSPGGFSATGASSPITITGLTNGVNYTFTVTAKNTAGTSAPSLPSNPAMPVGTASAPTITSVIAGNAQATITFTAPTNNGGQPILGYWVTSNPGGITRFDPASPIIIFGLTNGQSYTFTVYAITAAGNGAISAASSPGVIPLGPPGAPTITGVAAGNHQVIVSFIPPASNGGTAITTYTATSHPGGIINTGSTPFIVVGGLVNGQSYTFDVTATNSIGIGVPSIASSAVIPLGAPSSPTITTVTSGDDQLTVNFADAISNGGSPITGYTVVASSSAGSVTQFGNTLSIVVKGLINGVTYSVTVSATNTFGTSDPSAPVSGMPKGRPLAPTIGNVVGGNGQVSVSFTAPTLDGGSPILDYLVVADFGGFSQAGATSPITIGGLSNGQSYRFTVQARNAFGLSPKSALSAAVIPATVPAKPQILSATSMDGAANISFSLATSTGGSTITHWYITAQPGGAVQEAPTSPYIFTDLTNGVSYTFTMTAVNALGSSVNSDPSDPVVPAAPLMPDNAGWRIAVENDMLGANVDPLNGNAVNSDGSEYDLVTGATVLPASDPNVPVAYFGNDSYILTLNPETNEITTMNYTTIDLSTFEERDFNGNLVHQLDPSSPIYFVTTTGRIVQWDGSDQLNPYTGDTLASGEAFDIAPTPINYRRSHFGQ